MNAGRKGFAKFGWLNIEEVGPELHIDPLSDRGGLEQSEIPFLESRATERVSSLISEVPRTRNAILSAAGDGG